MKLGLSNKFLYSQHSVPNVLIFKQNVTVSCDGSNLDHSMIRIFQKKAELRTSLVSTLGVDFTILERDALKFSGEGEGEVGIFTTWVKKKLNKWEKLNKGNTATLLT